MIDPEMRDRLLAEPERVLEDTDLMAALIAANERALGSNIVDLRGIAMERLEARLDRLEDTHRTVVAAAYENLAGTNQVHRAILALLEPTSFDTFLARLGDEVAGMLKIDSLRLVLESHEQASGVRAMGPALSLGPAGYVQTAMQGSRQGAPRPVMLRQVVPGNADLHGEKAEYIRSEALLRLDLGKGRLPGMLVLGAEDPHQFKATHGTDLLAFFGQVFERVMQRWLA
jgi:uncharacterized protein YigA (DUF484 family)